MKSPEKKHRPANPAKRGRPKTFDHHAVIKAAMHLFWSHGFNGTSAGDIAESAGMQRSSFYNTFHTREEAFLAALQLYSETRPEAALARLERGSRVGPVVTAVIRKKCRLLADKEGANGCMFVNSLAELVGNNPRLGPALASAFDQRAKLAGHLIQEMVAQGDMKPPECYKASALALVAFLSGFTLLAKVVRDEGQLWQVCRTFLLNMGLLREIVPRS